MVSNPVDVLAYLAVKFLVLGSRPSGVICSGTNLDASRFLFFINEPPVINTQGVQESQPTTASLQPRTSFYVVPPQPPQSVQ